MDTGLLKNKNILWIKLTILFVVVLTNFILLVSVSYAQALPEDDTQAPGAGDIYGAGGVFETSPTNYVETTSGSNPSANQTTVTSEFTKAAKANSTVKTIWEMLDKPSALVGWFLGSVGELILTLSSLILLVTGKVLDIAMFFTTHMSEILDGIPIVEGGWEVFRDLANMVFIFILVYASISVVLGIGNPRQLIVNIIVTAILINFSLFITKAIVDASNIIALQFYNAINVRAELSQGPETYLPWLQDGPAAAFMQGLKLATIYDYERRDKTMTAINNLAGSQLTLPDILGNAFRGFTVAILGSITMLIAAFVFVAGGLMLLFRIIVLMFLMMISPLAFIARVLPMTKNGWDKWWHALIDNAIFAPAYMAMSYIIVRVIGNGFTGVKSLNIEGGSLLFAWAGMFSSLGLVVNYILMMIVLIMALVISKQLGAIGATTAIKVGKNLSGTVSGLVGRHTIGRAARWAEERATTSPAWTGVIGTKVRELTTQKLASAKYGGKTSAIEMKKEAKARVTGHEEAEKINAVKEEAKKGALADTEKIQNAMLSLSPAGVSKLDMKDIRKVPEIARFANEKQYQAVMSSDKSEGDKNQWTKLRFKHITDVFNKRREAEGRAKAMIQTNPNLAAAYKNGAGLKDMGVGWTDEDQKTFDTANNDVRSKSANELGYLNRVDPESINKIAPNLNWWQIKDMRKNDAYSYSQREGKGNSLRDFKETDIADAADIMFGIPMSDPGGKPRSIAERAEEREKSSRLWQKVMLKGENQINNPAVFNNEERGVWTRIKNVSLDQKKIAVDMIENHHRGRSPDELANGAGRTRNIPFQYGTYGASVVKPMMGKDSIHHKVLMTGMLRNYANSTLTEDSKAFLKKTIFDRDGQDFYSEWRELVKEMGLENDPKINDLRSWANEGAAGATKFAQGVDTTNLLETLPGVPRGTGRGNPPQGGVTPGGNPPQGRGGPTGRSSPPQEQGPILYGPTGQPLPPSQPSRTIPPPPPSSPPPSQDNPRGGAPKLGIKFKEGPDIKVRETPKTGTSVRENPAWRTKVKDGPDSGIKFK